MAINPKLLNPGERVLVSTRTHVKALLVPAIVLIVLAAVGGFLSAVISNGTAVLVVWIVVAVLFVIFCLVPFLRWLTSTYTFTDRRLITRRGILNQQGHDIPLNRISDVESQRSVLDRMLGCGTLIISDASTHGRAVLPDLPKVEEIQLKLSHELAGGDPHGHDADA